MDQLGDRGSNRSLGVEFVVWPTDSKWHGNTVITDERAKISYERLFVGYYSFICCVLQLLLQHYIYNLRFPITRQQLVGILLIPVKS